MLVPRAISRSMSISSASVLGASSTGISGHARRARPSSTPVAAKTRPRWRIAPASTVVYRVSSRRKRSKNRERSRCSAVGTLRKRDASMGTRVSATNNEQSEGEHHDQRQRLEERAAGGPREDHRQEDHAGGQGRGDDGAGDLARADPRRLLGRQPALLTLTHDALEDDDGVVDDAGRRPAPARRRSSGSGSCRRRRAVRRWRSPRSGSTAR